MGGLRCGLDAWISSSSGRAVGSGGFELSTVKAGSPDARDFWERGEEPEAWMPAFPGRRVGYWEPRWLGFLEGE